MTTRSYSNRTLRDWTPQEVTYLIREFNKNVQIAKIAQVLGRTSGSVTNKLSEMAGNGLIERRKHAPDKFAMPGEFIPSDEKNYDDFITIKGDTMNCSDIHIPFWHKELTRNMFAVAKKFKIKTLIINGDFLNLDSFSRWVTGFRGQTDTMRELKTAACYLQESLKIFKKIYLTTGNHEDRLFRQLEGQIPHSYFMKMISDNVGTQDEDKPIVVSDYPFCYVNDCWMVGHPKNYSDRGGNTPSDLADVYDMNVITGHNHQLGIQTSKNGKHVGIDHGVSADPVKIEYYNKTLSKSRRWQPGFSMILNNKGYLFSLYHTDWKHWL